MQETDETLVREYLEGNEQALVLLTTRYFDAIYRYACRFVRDGASAEDVVQDTFIKVWKSVAGFGEGMMFKPWIYRIAHNTAIDFLRKKKMISFSQMGDETVEELFSDESVDVLQETIAREEREELTGKIEQLPERYKQVVLLRAEDMLTFEEIGEVLQKPLNTVKSLYRRALQKLQE